VACPRCSFLRFWRSFGYNEGFYFVKLEIGLLEGGSLVRNCINLSDQQCINLSERYSDSPTDIKNRLGHENINATMVYLHMDLTLVFGL
jgi:hypothetical protein